AGKGGQPFLAPPPRPPHPGRSAALRTRHRMKRTPALVLFAALAALAAAARARAVEPKKQPIFANIGNGLLCGTAAANPCKVPAGHRLIIEYVSGFVFAPASAKQTAEVTMAVTDPG